jgi:hypothetical protein
MSDVLNPALRAGSLERPEAFHEILQEFVGSVLSKLHLLPVTLLSQAFSQVLLPGAFHIGGVARRLGSPTEWRRDRGARSGDSVNRLHSLQ